jgi:hypothetical protein
MSNLLNRFLTKARAIAPFGRKQQIKRRKLFTLLRALNLHIQKIKSENPPPRCKKVTKDIEKLYRLKEDVIIKLLCEGHLTVRCEQCHGRKRFYVIRASREITFHLPVNEKIKKAVEEYEQKEIVVRHG